MSRAMPSRRNVVRTAAWSVPVVAAAAAAPAYAASPCATTYAWRLDWGAGSTAYTRGSVVNGIQTGNAVITGAVGTSALTVTFRSEMFGTMQRDADNLRLSGDLTQTTPVTNVGGLGQGQGLNISHAAAIPTGRANRQEVQISFSRAVSNLSFVISDTDTSTGDWSDRVELTGTRDFTAPNISGSGTQLSPWRATNAGNAGNTSGSRNIAVDYTVDLAAGVPVTLAFWNNAGNSNQRVFLSDLTFDALGC